MKVESPKYPGIQILGSTTVTTPFYTVNDSGTYAAMLTLPSGKTKDSLIESYEVLGQSKYPGIHKIQKKKLESLKILEIVQIVQILQTVKILEIIEIF